MAERFNAIPNFHCISDADESSNGFFKIVGINFVAFFQCFVKSFSWFYYVSSMANLK